MDRGAREAQEMHKRVLITGCGRSGTNYASVLAGKCGLDLVHEQRMGKDGIASWLFGVDSATAPWGPAPAGYRFEHTFHLVRNPLSAIPSIATFRPAAWDYIAAHVPFEKSDSLLVKSAKYWLHWNTMVQRKADIRLRIEDMPGAMAAVCDLTGATFNPAGAMQVPSDMNTRRYGTLFNIYESTCLDAGVVRGNKLLKKMLSRLPAKYDDITWDELYALEGPLAEQIHGKAAEYGYEYGPATRAPLR